MNQIKLFFLLLLALATSCSNSDNDDDRSYKDTMSVIHAYSKKIRQEQKIWNSGYGLDYAGEDKIYDGKIHIISLAYRVDKNLKYEEARTYFYTIVDDLISHVNTHTELQQYFFHFPIDYSDLEFHFSFEDDIKGTLKRDEVASIHIIRNEIFYEIVNEEGSDAIAKQWVSPDIYIMQSALEKNRSIIRTVAEDLALNKK